MLVFLHARALSCIYVWWLCRCAAFSGGDTLRYQAFAWPPVVVRTVDVGQSLGRAALACRKRMPHFHLNSFLVWLSDISPSTLSTEPVWTQCLAGADCVTTNTHEHAHAAHSNISNELRTQHNENTQISCDVPQAACNDECYN